MKILRLISALSIALLSSTIALALVHSEGQSRKGMWGQAEESNGRITEGPNFQEMEVTEEEFETTGEMAPGAKSMGPKDRVMPKHAMTKERAPWAGKPIPIIAPQGQPKDQDMIVGTRVGDKSKKTGAVLKPFPSPTEIKKRTDAARAQYEMVREKVTTMKKGMPAKHAKEVKKSSIKPPFKREPVKK